MNAESSITLGIAVAGLTLGIVNMVLLLLIGKWLVRISKEIMSTGRQELSALGQWKQGVERQLGRLDGMIAQPTSSFSRAESPSAVREKTP